MRAAIRNRISRRSYLQTPIAAELQEDIRAGGDGLNRESGLAFAFAEDAGKAFTSMRKSYGILRRALRHRSEGGGGPA